MDFAKSLIEHPDLITPEASAAVLGVVAEIGEGTNPLRSSTVATAVLRNLAITLIAAATVAAFPIVGSVTLGVPGAIAGGLAGFLASESLKKSKPFADAVLPITNTLDKLASSNSNFMDYAKQKLTKQAIFVIDIESKLRQLTKYGEQFSWLNRSLDWIVYHFRKRR